MDLYAVLAISPEASTEEIVASWKGLQKAVHPDVAGAHAETAAALLNEARAVLVHAPDRDAHDADRAAWLARGGTDRDLFHVFATEPLSARSRREAPSRDARDDPSVASSSPYSDVDATRVGVFVDESQCIGCVQCATAAPNTFRIETRFGRARVVDQWADGREAVAEAIETCPVRCIHLVDAAADLPILERVAARLWKERGRSGSGISARSGGGGDASPFEVVDALRRRADPQTGLAPWPSRARRAAASAGGDARRSPAGADVDTSSAAAAVAAAVRAANAAAAVDAAETSDWRAGSFEEGTTERKRDGTDDAPGAIATLASASVAASVAAPSVPSRSGSERALSATNTSATHDTARDAASRREVARLHALLRDAPRASASPGGAASGSARASAPGSAPDDSFWKAPDEQERARLARDGVAFEASEDGDFAPSEWIRKVRRSRGRGVAAAATSPFGERADASEDARADASEATRAAAPPPPRARSDARRESAVPRPLALLATALLFAALGVAAAEPMDATAVVAGTRSGVSATGGWVGETSRIPVVGSRWRETACAAAAWYAALGILAETADAFAKRRGE